MRSTLEMARRCELNHDSPPMRLWRKAKRLGIWDPESFDLARDIEDWRGLSELEKELLLHLSSLFLAGEEAVVRDLLPLIRVISEQGRLEEEMYLTSFLWEEAKHVEAFSRFLTEVARGDTGDLSRFHQPTYKALFDDELPRSLYRLENDASPVALAEASVTYNMVIEGVMAETGYHAYHTVLAGHNLLPGMQQIVGHIKRDESRHLGYGVYLLSRLVAEHGDPVWDAIQQRMDHLLGLSLGVINETFALYDVLPFGLAVEDYVQFASEQFQRRMQRITLARGQTLDEVICATDFEQAET